MIPDQYVWLVWASLFLLPWALLYRALPRHRRTMRWASLFTAPFGLSEPLFVPEYWNPPTLFHLAQRTGFDIESIIFCFGIGGVAAVLYDVLTGRTQHRMSLHEQNAPRHRYHRAALAAPFVIFPVLLALPWNPIYPGIAAMLIGAAASVACRPDLKLKIWIGGALFTAYYFIFMQGLELLSPGYVARVWNLEALSGWYIARVPVEELGFALGFGMYWSGVYEHFTWSRSKASA